MSQTIIQRGAGGGGAGGGDAITVNGAAVVDADFDDATPAAPTGSTNVVWQKDASSPANVSANIAVAIIKQRVTATTDIVNTATETTLWSYDVPANLLGTNGMLHIVLLNDYLNNSGANKQVTVRVKLGATTLFDDITNLIGTAIARRAAFIELWLANVQATNVQQLNGRAEMSAATATTAGLGDFPGTPLIPGFTIAGSAAEDTTVAQTVSVTIQHSAAHANTSYRNRAGRVEVYP